MKNLSFLCFYNFVIFITHWGNALGIQSKQRRSSVLSPAWIDFNSHCSTHLLLQFAFSQESGRRKRETVTQDSEFALDEVRCHFLPHAQQVWGRINRQGMVWKTVNWKVITSTWEKTNWILHHTVEILF